MTDKVKEDFIEEIDTSSDEVEYDGLIGTMLHAMKIRVTEEELINHFLNDVAIQDSVKLNSDFQKSAIINYYNKMIMRASYDVPLETRLILLRKSDNVTWLDGMVKEFLPYFLDNANRLIPQ